MYRREYAMAEGPVRPSKAFTMDFVEAEWGEVLRRLA